MSEFILIVGDKQFLLGLNEAMEVASILNSASTIGSEWIQNQKGSYKVVKAPVISTAVVVPMTAIFKMELDANQKLLEESK
jgi:hypothetical protein